MGGKKEVKGGDYACPGEAKERAKRMLASRHSLPGSPISPLRFKIGEPSCLAMSKMT